MFEKAIFGGESGKEGAMFTGLRHDPYLNFKKRFQMFLNVLNYFFENSDVSQSHSLRFPFSLSFIFKFCTAEFKIFIWQNAK